MRYPQLRKRARAAGGYALAMYAVRLAAIAKNLVLAAALGPSEFGLVAAFLTVLSYTAYLDLGIHHAIYREVPVARGRGDDRRAASVIRAAYGGSLAVGLAAAACLGLVAALQAANAVPGRWWLSVGLAAAVLGQQLAWLLYNVALAEERFGTLARGLAAGAAVDLAASAAAGIAWGAEGAILAGSIGLFVQYLIVLRGLAPRPWPIWSPRLVVRLAAIGIPIALIWFGNTNFVVMDKLVALIGLGQSALGRYTLASAVATVAMVGPMAVATLLGPGILQRIGEAEAGRRALDAAARAVDVAAATSGVLLAAGIAAVPALAETLLPDYVPAVRAAQILLAASAVLASAIPLTTYLVGRGAQWRVVRLYLLSSLFNLGFDVVALSVGWGLTGIATGSLVSFALFALLIRRVAAPDELPRLLRSLVPVAAGALVGGAIAGALAAAGVADDLLPALAGSAAALVLAGGFSFAYALRA